MTEITIDQLEEISQFSYKYMLKKEISIITGVEIELLNDEDSAAGIAFLKGRLMRKAEFNSSLIQLTKQLSSPAMAIEFKIAESTYLNDHKKTMKLLGKVSAYDSVVAFMKDEKSEVDLSPHEKQLVLRWNEAFTLLRNYQSTADAAAILMKRFPGISRATAYRDCANAINLFGDISKSTKDGIRHLSTEMVRDAFKIAYQQNDADAMIKAASAIAKINGVNLNDPEQINWDEIEPHTYLLGLDEQMLRALRSMIKAGKIDLTPVVETMNNMAIDTEFTEVKE